MASDHGTATFAIGILGNFISFLVFLVPMQTFYGVYRNSSTEGVNSVPYVVAFFSCLIWAYYALLKTNAIILITINSIGLLIEAIYIAIYLIYAPIRSKIFTAGMVFFNVCLFGLILAITQLVCHGHERLNVLGWICVIFSVSVFIAPLSTMVIHTRNSRSIPINLSLFLTISAVVWLCYGLLSKDKFIMLPNILGLLFSIIQIVLYCIYKDARSEVADGSNMTEIEPEIAIVATIDVPLERMIEQIV